MRQDRLERAAAYEVPAFVRNFAGREMCGENSTQTEIIPLFLKLPGKSLDRVYA
jgi:hypothetical protein